MSQERERIAGVWFYGTLAYCVVVSVAEVLSDTHHSGGGMMPPLLRVFFAPAMRSFSAQAIYAGQVRGRWGASIARDVNPIAFWLSVGVFMVLGCYLLFSGLRFESP
jgi:apolipoprotein N-acyltransferase